MKDKDKSTLIANFNIKNLADEQAESAYWNKGFNYSISRVSALLGVSKSWIAHTLIKEVKHVVYSQKFAYTKNNSRCLTYIRREDLSAWIMKNGRFERQTEIVDLYSYISPYKDVLSDAYELYRANLRVKKGENRPIMPNNVLNLINDRLLTYGIEQNCHCDKRTNVHFSQIEPFDIFSREKDLYNAKDAAHKGYSRETIYRNAFLNGDIRIKISEQITVFVKTHNRINSMKMPFLIQYNKPIRIEKYK